MGKYNLVNRIKDFIQSFIWSSPSEEECYVWTKYLNCVFYRTTSLGKLLRFKIQKLSWEDSRITFVDEIPFIEDYLTELNDDDFKP